jgi:hypothetical protein
MGASIFFTATMLSARSRDYVGTNILHEYAQCTVTTDLLVWYSNTSNNLSTEAAISHYRYSHRLAAEIWTAIKNNFMKNFFWVVSFICTGFGYTCPTHPICTLGSFDWQHTEGIHSLPFLAFGWFYLVFTYNTQYFDVWSCCHTPYTIALIL